MTASADGAPGRLRLDKYGDPVLDKRGDPIHRGYDVRMKHRRSEAERLDPYPGLNYDYLMLILCALLAANYYIRHDGFFAP